MAIDPSKALVSVRPAPRDSAGDPQFLSEKDRALQRVYNLSAAELLQKEYSAKGLLVKDSNEERQKKASAKLSRFYNWLRRRNTTQAYYDHLKAQFSGGRGRTLPHKFDKPSRQISHQDVESYAGHHEINGLDAKRPFLDPFGHIVWKYEDVDVYLSPTDSIPRRLMVMTTTGASRDTYGVTWRRTKLKGNIPIALRMSEWALSPSIGWFRSTMRSIVVALPLQALLAFPGATAPWEMDDVDDSYRYYTAYHWKWPKHAINPLDARRSDREDLNDHERPQLSSSKQRLMRPRQLMVYDRASGHWNLVQNPDRTLQYIFVSYHWGSFKGFARSTTGQDRVDEMAQQLTLDAGLEAYFRDEHCIAKPDAGREIKTSDINRMCDVIRGSRFVALLLPDDQPRRMVDWGQRLWTLPEGMLAPGNLHVFTYLGEKARGPLQYKERLMSRAELTAEFWNDKLEDDDVPVRALAEHYDGTTILGRLELFSCAVAALSVRKTTEYSGADLGYALMGLLHYRINPDPTDDLFQVIARLSLANDSDCLIERCISLLPLPTTDTRELLRMLAGKDQYYSHLWDIKPKCEVVGVGDEPDTVILNDCKAVPIRWKSFPRINYQRHEGFRKMFAGLVVRSGAWWLVAGYSLAFTYAPIFIGSSEMSSPIFNIRWLYYAIILFIGIAIILSSFAPKAVHRLFSGQVLESAPHLIAFEGTMPKAELERIIFGFDRDRLSYEPSSTPFAAKSRYKYIRQSYEPDWIAASSNPPDLFPGHRVFTLVDTGNLSISVFQAKRPPTVALITGSEGGMLRAVLCSWRFYNDCHYRETVIRVPTGTWEQAQAVDWIKVCLKSQGDFLPSQGLQQSPDSFLPQQSTIASPLTAGSIIGSPNQPQSPLEDSMSPIAAVRPALSAKNSSFDSTTHTRPALALLGNGRAKKERKASQETSSVGIEISESREQRPMPEALRVAKAPATRSAADAFRPLPPSKDITYSRPSDTTEVTLAEHHQTKQRSSPFTGDPTPGNQHTVEKPDPPSGAGRRSSRDARSPKESLQTDGQGHSSQAGSVPRRPVARSSIDLPPTRSETQQKRQLPDSKAKAASSAIDRAQSSRTESMPSPLSPTYRPSPMQTERIVSGLTTEASLYKRSESEASSSLHEIPVYKVPSPPPQLPPLSHSSGAPSTSASSPTPSHAQPLPQPRPRPAQSAHPLASRFSVQPENRHSPEHPDASPAPPREPRGSWGAEAEDSLAANRLKPRELTKAPAKPSRGHERKKSDQKHQQKASIDSTEKIAQSSSSSPHEFSSMVSPRIDFATHSWEYWNGAEEDKQPHTN